MKIINAFPYIKNIYDNEHFNLEKWKEYIDKYVPGAKELCLNDMEECLSAGFTWENDFLPVLESAFVDKEKSKKMLESFNKVVDGLDEKIINIFNRTVDVDIILYLGLCNGAGWVTKINNKTVILLGIEKILELDWHNVNEMNGLIIHELGHVYQSQYGILETKSTNNKEKFIWQLFTEGVAMVFEQLIIGDNNYFHQDTNGWKKWCKENLELIASAFNEDLETMTQEDQRYFGDWVLFEGYGDTGYYLGTIFVRYLLDFDSFDNVINYDLDKVKEEYKRFFQSLVDIN